MLGPQGFQKDSGKQQLSKLFQLLLINFPLLALSCLVAHAVKSQERKAALAQSLSFPCMDEKDYEPVWATVITLSVALCTAAQPAAHASLQLSSYPLTYLNTWLLILSKMPVHGLGIT